MFQHLKLNNHKGLKFAGLINLGKINILCGKNSSGKSTILETLLYDEKVDIGLTFDGEITQELINQWDGISFKPHVSGLLQQTKDQERFFEIAIKKVIAKNDVYFYEDNRDFLKMVSDEYDNLTNQPSYQVNLNKMSSYFETIFKIKTFPNIELLPPKRLS